MAQRKRTSETELIHKNDNRVLDLSLTDMRRNPYLVDYQEYRARAGRNVNSSGNRKRMGDVRQMKPSANTQPKRTTTVQKTKRKAGVQQTPSMIHKQKSKHTIAVQRRRKLRRIKRAVITMIFVAFVICVVTMVPRFFGNTDVDGSMFPIEGANEGVFDNAFGNKVQGISAKAYAKHPQWTEDFLTPNEYSRPGDSLKKVDNIFVHYTANKGTSAAQNRSYFEQLKDNHERSASAHFIIGYEGEIIQCIPLDEIGYAVQTRNFDSISIECCYLEEDGSFTQETYDSLLKLLRWLLDTYDLEEDDILRHYDCGGKLCPLYYAEHEDAWKQLKEDVKNS